MKQSQNLCVCNWDWNEDGCGHCRAKRGVTVQIMTCISTCKAKHEPADCLYYYIMCWDWDAYPSCIFESDSYVHSLTRRGKVYWSLSRCLAFATVEWALFLQRGRGLFHHHDAPPCFYGSPEQTNWTPVLKRDFFPVLSGHRRGGWGEGCFVLFVAMCNLIARCH